MTRSSSVTCCSRIGPATRIAPTDYGPGASLCGGRAFRGRHWSGLPATNSLVKRLSGWGEERVDERGNRVYVVVAVVIRGRCFEMYELKQPFRYGDACRGAILLSRLEAVSSSNANLVTWQTSLNRYSFDF